MARCKSAILTCHVSHRCFLSYILFDDDQLENFEKYTRPKDIDKDLVKSGGVTTNSVNKV